VNDGYHFCRIFLSNFSSHFDADCTSSNDDHVCGFVDLHKINIFDKNCFVTGHVENNSATRPDKTFQIDILESSIYLMTF
jgi:hypothetical protein